MTMATSESVQHLQPQPQQEVQSSSLSGDESLSSSSSPSTRRTFALPNLNQSTIYRRHEARLAKSYALREDPRPAVLRVMSGLPGFRMIVPPYQPNSLDENAVMPATVVPTTAVAVAAIPKIGDYSESTLFTTNDAIGEENATTTKNTKTLISAHPQQQQQQRVVLQAMFATGVTAAAAEYFLGSHLCRSASRNISSPFGTGVTNGGGNATKYYSPFISQNAGAAPSASGLSVHLQNHKQSSLPKSAAGTSSAVASSSSAAAAAMSSISSRQLAFAASSTSLLFGTKVFVEQQQDGLESSILASAVAGAVVGAFRQVSLRFALPSAKPGNSATFGTAFASNYILPNQTLRSVLPRHVLAATLYFSTYEQLKAWNANSSSMNDAIQQQQQPQSNSTNLEIALAGAAAGCIYTAILVPSSSSSLAYHALSGIPTAAAATTTTTVVRAIPTILKAAPIHALIFMGYEGMKKHAE